jgi:hypothetical protein
MSTPNLSDLIAEVSVDQIKQRLITILQGLGLPVNDWSSGSFPRQVVQMQSQALSDLVASAQPEIIKGGFLDLANDQWLPLKASQDFDTEQLKATFTVQLVTLTCAGGAGPYTIAAGDLVAVAPTNNRYRNITSGTLTSSVPLVLQFQAESPGAAYSDPSGSINKLVTTLAGVTISNSAPDFTNVVQGPSGTGTIAPSRTVGGTPPTLAAFLIRIDASGVIGTGGWSYSTTGGQSFTSVGAISSTFALPGGTTITFTNGAGTPSFIAGDFFSFETPGSAIITQGRDLETSAALVARCKARWTSLSDVPTNDKITLWALASSDSINRVRIRASSITAGQIDVFLAGPGGGVSGTTVKAAQDYILARLGISEKVSVQSSTGLAIPVSGTVFVSASLLASSQSKAQLAWQQYLSGSSIADTIRLSRLEQILMDAMAGDHNADLGSGGSAIALTGGTPNIVLAANQVAVPDSVFLSVALTWIPVT